MRILLIGDYATDVFVQGRCERLSPERPCPVFLPMASGSNAGMAGNVEANLRSLSPGIEVTTLYSDKPSVKIRYVDKASNQHLLRVDTDTATDPLPISRFLDAVNSGTFSAVVLSDYRKGLLNTDNMGAIADICDKRGIPVLCDTKAILSDWSRSITAIKINAKEYAAQLAANVKNPWDYCRNLIVTQGGDGIVLFSPDGSERYRAKHGDKDIHVYDTVGCGDSVLAALTIRYLETGDLHKAMDFAVQVGSIAASQRGVVAVKREDIQ